MATKTLHDSVVVEEERLEPREVREVVDLPDLVVGEVDRVELVQRRAEVFDHRDFVAYGMSKEADQKLNSLNKKSDALQARLKDLAQNFEEATVDKKEQEEKVIKMQHKLNTACMYTDVCTYVTN